jgi:hypothetical protein
MAMEPQTGNIKAWVEVSLQILTIAEEQDK